MEVAVIGAGLTGLSAAFHLRGKRKCTVFESSSRPGGLVRSEKKDGFIFDYTGHFLHFKNPANRSFISDNLGVGLSRIERKSFILAAGRMVPYPFQSNIGSLPENIKQECLAGFLEAALHRTGKGSSGGDNFYKWMIESFGEGITRHFMLPYNRKLWSVHPREMSLDWMGRFVPSPGIEEVIAGAVLGGSPPAGYNSVFYYPPRGIGELPEKLAESLPEGSVMTGSRVEEVDPLNKTLSVSGKKFRYGRLILTSPLKEFLLKVLKDPGPLAKEASKLRNSSLLNVNLGWEGDPPSSLPGGTHWVYFPQEEYLFYRVGFPPAVSEHLAPPGSYSCYTEISFKEGSLPSPEEYEGLEDKVIHQLTDLGIIPPGAVIKTRLTLRIDPAYVIYDRARQGALEKIRAVLEEKDIYIAGRYGAWEYSTMEDAIEWGRGLAEKCQCAG